MKFWSLVQKIWEGFKQQTTTNNNRLHDQVHLIVTDENFSSGTKNTLLRDHLWSTALYVIYSFICRLHVYIPSFNSALETGSIQLSDAFLPDGLFSVLNSAIFVFPNSARVTGPMEWQILLHLTQITETIWNKFDHIGWKINVFMRVEIKPCSKQIGGGVRADNSLSNSV